MRRWVYLPNSWEYAVPWIAAPLIGFVLTIFDVPKGKAPSLPSDVATIWGYIAVTASLAALNGLLFWVNLRGQFLLWRTAWRPFTGTFALLTVSYLLAYAFFVVLTRRAHPSFIRPDVIFTAQCAALAMLAMAASLGMSTVVKTEEPGFSNLRQQRRRARTLLKRLVQRSPQISTADYTSLVTVLGQIVATATATKSLTTSDEDVRIIDTWMQSCDDLRGRLAGNGPAEFWMAEDRMRPAAEATCRALA